MVKKNALRSSLGKTAFKERSYKPLLMVVVTGELVCLLGDHRSMLCWCRAVGVFVVIWALRSHGTTFSTKMPPKGG